KLVLSCNKPPIVDNPDNASRNRIRLYPHTSEWLSEGYPPTYEEQLASRKFKMDPNFEDQIPGMAQAFLWLLVQYYHIYKIEGLNDSPSVKEYPKSYWQENDIYAQFKAKSVAPALHEHNEYDSRARVT